jgi:imidazolonepropionase-like amidohydrolase
MKTKLQLIATLVCLSGVVACGGNSGSADGSEQSPATETPSTPVIEADLAFVDVSVLPMTSEVVLERRTVLVRDGTIVAIAPSGEIAFGDRAITVPGDGRFLIPGLADMHVHILDPSALDLFVGHGITLVRNMWGAPNHLQWREQIESRERLGPRIVTAGAIVDGVPPIWEGSVGVADAAAAIAEMDAQKAAGYDFLKIYERLPAEAFDAIASHSREIGLPYAGHVPQAVAIDHAMRSGMRTIEHLTGWDDATAVTGSEFESVVATDDLLAQFVAWTAIGTRLQSGQLRWEDVVDPAKRDAIAALAAETDVWHVPTLVVLERISTSRRQAETRLAEPAMRYISPQVLTLWNPENDFRRQFSDDQLEALRILFMESLVRVKALHDAGANLLAGTDTPNPWVVPGIGLHQELALLVEAGLSPYDALVMATRAPAEFLHDDSFGTIAEGQRADLVLLEANPFENIGATREIAGVAMQNRWLPRSELDAMLDRVAESAKVGPTPP